MKKKKKTKKRLEKIPKQQVDLGQSVYMQTVNPMGIKADFENTNNTDNNINSNINNTTAF